MKTFTLWKAPYETASTLPLMLNKLTTKYLDFEDYEAVEMLLDIIKSIKNELKDNKSNHPTDFASNSIIVWNMPVEILGEYKSKLKEALFFAVEMGAYEHSRYLLDCMVRTESDYKAHLLKESEKDGE